MFKRCGNPRENEPDFLLGNLNGEGNVIYSHGTNHSKGVAILFNPKLDVRIGSSEADKIWRHLLLGASTLDCTFLFCNIYSPKDNNSQITFFSKLSDSLKEAR